jgi:hypothetical protein
MGGVIMHEYEALLSAPDGGHMVVSAWGASLEDATQRAAETLAEDFPQGWLVTLSGALRSWETIPPDYS